MSRYDTVVIGAGLAGLLTACQVAQANKKVLLTTTGLGSLLLATGCVDVLGYQPATSQEPVKDPLGKLNDFLNERPAHPYHHLGQAKIETGLKRFQDVVNNGLVNYQGEPNRNWLLPSGAGAIHPTCLAPTSLSNGELSQSGSMLIVGFRELRDFYPSLISQNLNAQSLDVQVAALTINAPRPIAGQMNTTPIELAKAFDTPDFRQKVVKAIKGEARKYDRVGFPAVLGLKQHSQALADLEKQLGKTVFEISTLPPSVPGRRLYEALKDAFLKANGRLVIGSKVVDGAIDDGQVQHIRVETSNRLRTIRANHYVLATGGIFGGGIQTDADGGIGQVWEPIFDLPIKADENRHMWFAQGFLDPNGQPVAQYGVAVNDKLNPVDDNQQPIADNLYIAGSLIAHSDWTRGRTGDGVAVATAAAIAEQITS